MYLFFFHRVKISQGYKLNIIENFDTKIQRFQFITILFFTILIFDSIFFIFDPVLLKLTLNYLLLNPYICIFKLN